MGSKQALQAQKPSEALTALNHKPKPACNTQKNQGLRIKISHVAVIKNSARPGVADADARDRTAYLAELQHRCEQTNDYGFRVEGPLAHISISLLGFLQHGQEDRVLGAEKRGVTRNSLNSRFKPYLGILDVFGVFVATTCNPPHNKYRTLTSATLKVSRNCPARSSGNQSHCCLHANTEYPLHCTRSSLPTLLHILRREFILL